MKHLCTRLLVIAVLGMLLAMAGCVFDESDLVITERVCVTFEQHQTTGTFTSFGVCDLFRQRLLAKLAENNKTVEDIESIHFVSAIFKTMSMNTHDWSVTADIEIARRDDPSGPITDGPAPLVSFEDQSLAALKGQPTDADLHADGVALVNRALESLLNGDDPQLVLFVNNESVVPTPTPSDPLDFKFLTCVNFQVVVGISNGSN